MFREADVLSAERSRLQTPGPLPPDCARAPIVEEAEEPFEDHIDGPSDFSQGVINWKPINERYLDGHVGIHFHFGIRAGDHQADPQDFCAYVQRMPNDGAATDFAFDVAVPSPMWEATLKTSRSNGRRNDEPMLVVIVDVTQESEGVKVQSLPALVWLKPLDDCPMGVRNILKHVRSAAGEIGGPPHDWKLGLAVGRVYAPAVDVGHLPDEVVKGRPQVVSGITYRKAKARKLGHLSNSHNPILRLRVELLVEDYRWSVQLPQEPVALFLESLNVFDSPSQLRISTVKSARPEAGVSP